MKKPLARLVSGPDKAPVIAALHGVTDNAASLCHIAERWNRSHRVVLFDSPGHGLSPRVGQREEPMRYIIDKVAKNLVALAKEAGPITLLGHSMGGAIAAEVSRMHPEILRAVILEDPSLLTRERLDSYRAGIPDSLRHVDAVAADPAHFIAENRRDYPTWPVSEVGPWAQAKIQVDRDFLAAGEVGVVTDLADYLSTLIVPTLLLTGDRPDAIHGHRAIEACEAAGNELVTAQVIENAGHCVRRDNGEAFYRAVESFCLRGRSA
ncbi:MAG: alpha/beta fold hydrolase [Flaviflexus sp.]|nr:alpha/beta fold hydrolase [Flaviflexus sp.]